MKLILPVEIAHELEPHLPENTIVVRVDSEGNIDGDATDAEVYFSWFYLKPTTLHRVLDAAPSLSWHTSRKSFVDITKCVYYTSFSVWLQFPVLLLHR